MPRKRRLVVVKLHCTIDLDISRLAKWEPEKVEALLRGIAQIVSAEASKPEERKDEP